MRNFFRQLIAITGLVALVPNLAAADASIRVLVSAQHLGDNIVYHYTIINNGTQPFNNIVIGSRYDSAKDDTFPELGKLPVGWSYGTQGETGVEIILDPVSTTQPAGWVTSAYGQEDTAFLYLDWRVSSGQTVQPGQTLSGFSVTVPKGRDTNLIRMPGGSDLKYLTGHFTVGLPSGPDVHGAIERQDTTPPILSVSQTPTRMWPPNGKLTPVYVSIAVSDDYDPSPEVILESITANESLDNNDVASALFGADDRQFNLAAKRTGTNKEGRIYTITYSATDASGNKAIATASVVVPHDQRK